MCITVGIKFGDDLLLDAWSITRLLELWLLLMCMLHLQGLLLLLLLLLLYLLQQLLLPLVSARECPNLEIYDGLQICPTSKCENMK